jgi:hypothetical protein
MERDRASNHACADYDDIRASLSHFFRLSV